MPRPHYKNVPLFSGETAQLSQVLLQANDSHKQMCVLGDSTMTEAGNGQGVLPELNRQAFLRFGRPSKTPWMPCKTYRPNGTPPTRWMVSGEAVNITASGTDRMLPDYEWGLNTTSSQGARFDLRPDGEGCISSDQLGYSLADYGPDTLQSPTNWIWESLIPRDTTYAASEARVYEMHNEPASNLFFLNNANELRVFTVTSSANLTADSSSFYTLQSPPLVYHPTGPLVSVYANLYNGSATVAGLKTACARYRNTGFDSGISFVSFSFGGGKANTFLTNHGNAGPIMAAMGAWDCVFVWFGINHFGTDTLEAYKTATQTLITTLRGSSWLNNANQLICLVAPHPIQTENDSFQQLAAVNAELASENANVAAVNFTRWIRQHGAVDDLLTDTVHYSIPGQQQEGRMFWQMLDQLGIGQ